MFFTLIKSGSISLLITVAFALPSFSQVTQTGRFELAIEERADMENPRVASLGKQGALIYRKIRDNAKDFVELIKIDSSLQENWRGTIKVDRNLVIAKVQAHEQFAFILFNSVLFGGFDFPVVVVNAQTQEYHSYIVKNLIPLKPTEFIATRRSLLIGGYFNDIPVVLHFSLATGQSRLLPGFFNDPGELNQIKAYDDGFIDIIVSTKNLQRKKVLWLRTYTPEGDLINSTVIQDTEKSFLMGKSLRKADGTLLVTGTFNVRNSDYSKGIFITEINNEGKYTIHYHNYTDLENFFKYMKPAREARVKERIARRNEKGKKLRNVYYFLPHELKQNGDEFLFTGEVYYPRYYYLNSFGNSYRGDRIFDGYRYTHAAIVGINERGDLTWDNSFEINDIKTFRLIQYVKMAPLDEDLGLLYLYENKVRSKTIYHDKVLEAKAVTELELKFSSDLVKEKNTESSLLEYWYDPYFLAYGIQYVNSSMASNAGRRVLFINKLKIP